MEEKLLFTIAEAAYMLNCSSGHVQTLIHSGKLKYTVRRHNYYISSESLIKYRDSVLSKVKKSDYNFTNLVGDRLKPIRNS